METETTILLVENDSASPYESRLEREGFHVRTAGDKLGALKVLTGAPPDLVVLDLMLRRSGGTELFKFIRTTPRLKHLPVIIFSNATMTEWPKGVEIGSTRCLLKNENTFPMLLKTIRDMLAPGAGSAAADHPESEPSAEMYPTEFLVVPREQAEFIGKAREIIPSLREHCLTYVKEPASESGKKHLEILHSGIQMLHDSSTIFEKTDVAALLKGFDTLVSEVALKPNSATPSILNTLVQGVDCLRLCLENTGVLFSESEGKTRILAVDDDPICNHVVTTTLNRAGFDICTMESPVQALKLLEVETFDTILLDVNMPGMTGFQLCEKLRELPPCKTVPVIFITAFSNFDNRKQSVLSGGHDFITKPISPWELALKLVIHRLKMKFRSAETSTSESRSEQPEPKLTHQLISQITESGTDHACEETWHKKEQTAFAEAGDLELCAVGETAALPATVVAMDSTAASCSTEDVKAVSASPDIQRRTTSTASDTHFVQKMPELKLAGPTSVTAAGPEPRGEKQSGTTPNPATPAIAKSEFHSTKNTATKAQIHSITRSTQDHMKEKSNTTFDKIVHEVARIIFGDENLNDINLRLVRMALERHNIQDLVREPSAGS